MKNWFPNISSIRLTRMATWDEAVAEKTPRPMDASDIIKTMCDLNYIVHHNGETQVYSGRRAYPISYCRAIAKDWKRVTHGQKIVCLDGEGGEYSLDINGQKIKSWTWDKIKTKKGCYSYFEGECSDKMD